MKGYSSYNAISLANEASSHFYDCKNVRDLSKEKTEHKNIITLAKIPETKFKWYK